MKYEIQTDKNNNIVAYYPINNEVRNAFLELEDVDNEKMFYSKLIDGEIILDEEKYQADQLRKEINNLKAELSSTDYQIIKCSEYQIQGLKSPYDILNLHASRQALRDRINELEAKI